MFGNEDDEDEDNDEEDNDEDNDGINCRAYYRQYPEEVVDSFAQKLLDDGMKKKISRLS